MWKIFQFMCVLSAGMPNRDKKTKYLWLVEPGRKFKLQLLMRTLYE